MVAVPLPTSFAAIIASRREQSVPELQPSGVGSSVRVTSKVWPETTGTNSIKNSTKNCRKKDWLIFFMKIEFIVDQVLPVIRLVLPTLINHATDRIKKAHKA